MFLYNTTLGTTYSVILELIQQMAKNCRSKLDLKTCVQELTVDLGKIVVGGD